MAFQRADPAESWQASQWQRYFLAQRRCSVAGQRREALTLTRLLLYLSRLVSWTVQLAALEHQSWGSALAPFYWGLVVIVWAQLGW